MISLQHTSVSPDGKLLVIVGDDPDGMLVDSQTGKVSTALPPHVDICKNFSPPLI